MGQAKRRGTYEQRKEAAIEDNKRTIRLLREQEDAWWNSLTSEEQQTVSENRLKRAKALASIAKWTSLNPCLRMSRFGQFDLRPGYARDET